jgi:hypothetical protein
MMVPTFTPVLRDLIFRVRLGTIDQYHTMIGALAT